MRIFTELRETTNSYVYNKLYKRELEQRGKIRCSICAVHRGENDERKTYGSTNFWRKENAERMRHPSWKLVSKNRKQWMNKPLRNEIKKSMHFGEYAVIKW